MKNTPNLTKIQFINNNNNNNDNGKEYTYDAVIMRNLPSQFSEHRTAPSDYTCDSSQSYCE